MKNGIISGIRHILGVRMFTVVLVILSLTIFIVSGKIIRSLFNAFRVNPKFCVNCKTWRKIEQNNFKAGAAQAAAALSIK